MSVVVFPRDELCYIESQLLLSLLTRLWMLIEKVGYPSTPWVPGIKRNSLRAVQFSCFIALLYACYRSPVSIE